MTKLTFQGPFHFSDINKDGIIKKGQRSFDLNTSGIYIWGFMYEFNSEKKLLGNAIDFTKEKIAYTKGIMQFIPYYVGKSENHIYHERIFHHHDVRNTFKSKTVHAQKYTRLHHDYMTKFFNDDLFPIKVWTASREKEFIKLLNNVPVSITYYNNPVVLKKIYPNIKPIPVSDGYPITDQTIDQKNIPDTLDDLVNNLNNFWFCFAESKESGKRLEVYETTVFYSLKGRTISMTRGFNNVDEKINIHDETNTRIFNRLNNRIEPKRNFPGYIEIA